MDPNLNMLRGFRKEFTKTAELDTKGGLQGAALGALIGAVLGGISPLILAKMLKNNAGLTALLGGLAGAGGGAFAGTLLGKKESMEQQKSAGAGEAAMVSGIGAKTVATPKNPVLGNKSGVAHASATNFSSLTKKLMMKGK